MAETKTFTQVPDIHHPIGTLKEAEEVGIKGDKLRATPTCSDSGSTNMGCRFKNECPFEGIAGVSGPINLAVRRVTPENLSGETLKTCVAYMQTDHALAMRGEPITICGIEPGHDTPLNDLGHTYIHSQTRKIHETKNPDCPGCKRGDCVLYEDIAPEEEIVNFQRPNQTMSGVAANDAVRARIKRDLGLKVQATRMGVPIGRESGPAGRVSPRPRKGPQADRPADETGEVESLPS